MQPLHIIATIAEQIALPNGPLALDGVLAAQVALRLGLDPPMSGSECQPIEIPVQRSECRRFHLCSFSVGQFERFDLRYINRRPVVEQAQALAHLKAKRMDISTGRDKGYRIPMEVGHLVDDRLEWWCVGERDGIEELLSTTTHLGKKRSVGLGRVVAWSVVPCEPWGDGFPIVRDGQPLRPLPAAWPGLIDPTLAYRTITFPYWDHSAEELCAIPSGSL